MPCKLPTALPPLGPRRLGTDSYMNSLEQNLGIASASIVPVFAYFEAKRAARDEEAASLDASSMFSKMTFASKLSKLSRRNSTGSTILIQGPNRDSYDPTAAAQLRSPTGGEFLPLGIIKTVSVQVSCENSANAEYGFDASRSGSRPGTAQSGLDTSRPNSRRGQDQQHWLDPSRPSSRRTMDQ